MDNKEILEPLKEFNNNLKETHHQNSEDFFDELVKKYEIDVELNRETVKNYNQAVTEGKYWQKKENSIRGVRAFLVVLAILLIFGCIFTIYYSTTVDGYMKALFIGIGVVLALLAIFTFVQIKIRINKAIKKRQKNKEEKFRNAEEKKKEGYDQLQRLNEGFDWDISSKIIKKTCPLINLDNIFNIDKFKYLNEKYGFSENNDEHSSTQYVKSGDLQGNPFVIINTFNQTMINKRYEGTLVIHWTTRSTDAKGNTQVHHHTQTLVAYITKPAPDYYYDTKLVYGCDAAPNLSFGHEPTEINGKTEKQIKSIVKRKDKELDKKARKSVVNGQSFTKMANSEFEVLFNGDDRDNEMEFRLLFTPLAQRNMVDLLKSQKPYGDDFYFYKRKCLNYITSYHSQTFNYQTNPEFYTGFDIDEMKKRFVEYNDLYFQSLYFDLAPLLSIPAYQQTKTYEYIYDIPYSANISFYEHESLANRFNVNELKHKESATNVILKTSFERKEGKSDVVKIAAHSFKSIPHTDFVPTLGGDGKIHQVPVTWYEYIPLVEYNYMEIEDTNMTKEELDKTNIDNNFKNISQYFKNNGIIYERGLMSLLLKNSSSVEAIDKIKNLMKKGD